MRHCKHLPTGALGTDACFADTLTPQWPRQMAPLMARAVRNAAIAAVCARPTPESAVQTMALGAVRQLISSEGRDSNSRGAQSTPYGFSRRRQRKFAPSRAHANKIGRTPNRLQVAPLTARSIQRAWRPCKPGNLTAASCIGASVEHGRTTLRQKAARC